MPSETAFLVLLACALVGAIVAFRWAIRRVGGWSRLRRALTPIAFCLFGFVPAVLIKAGLVPWSAPTVIAAVIYFIAFSVAATVALNGAIARSSPNTSLERTREG